jgi:hypothetical protein
MMVGGGALLGFVVSVFAMPVLWFVIRLVGLIDPLLNLLGEPILLMQLGGLIMGGALGAILLTVLSRAYAQPGKTVTIVGLVGGALGGFIGSVLFFPLVAFL